MRQLQPALFVTAMMLLIVGCARPAAAGLPPAPTPTPVAYPPITFPRDEAPHQDLTEWWYYTGHLEAADGRRWGFELVVFQVLRGPLPPYYLSHFAITDRQRLLFRYDERGSQGAQPQPKEGFALSVGGWSIEGLNGRDRLRAGMAEYAIDLALSTDRPPVLHDGGIVSFGPAGDSYYYSRTRMDVTGTILDNGEPISVRGSAWCDRQWGNFLVLGGGWDWFSIQLDDRSDLMLNYIRDAAGIVRLAYGTFVEPDGTYRHLRADEIELTATGQWTSPRSGGTYPMGWIARVPGEELELRLQPVLEDQELDTRRTTSVVYWEGVADVTGSRRGRALGGNAYVEMTGYAPMAR